MDAPSRLACIVVNPGRSRRYSTSTRPMSPSRWAGSAAGEQIGALLGTLNVRSLHTGSSIK